MDMRERATLHKVEEVIESIQIWSMAKDYIDINLTAVRLIRMNYPYNCFSLDLTSNKEVEEKGVRQLFFSFHMMANTSVELLLQGHSLVCNRDIKYHKFFSSGADVKLTNLGKPSFLSYFFQ